MLESRLLEAMSLERCGSVFVPTNPQPSSINRLMKKNPLLIFLLLAVACFFVQRQSASANFFYQQQKPFITSLAPPGTFTVNTLGDNADNSVGNGVCDSDAAAGDQCTLRAAIQEVNFAGSGTISFNLAAGSVIVLSSALPNIASNVTFDGPTTRVVISGNNNSRVFTVDPGKTVAISNLMISNGRANSGGGINNAGTLTLTGSTIGGDNSSILGNRTNDGADVSGALNGGNGGDGGGIYNTGTLRLINCTVSGNQTGRGGNANTGNGGNGGNGGGIYNSGTLTLTNTTVAANQRGSFGSVNSSGPGTPGSSGTGGGIFNTVGTLTLNNTIVARNPDDNFAVEDDINGAVDPTSSFNLIGAADGMSGMDLSGSGNQSGTADAPLNPLLGTLQDNGGPTWTHALLDFSPAIDTGSNALAKDQNNNALATDQRGVGFPRIVHGTVDIGAFEAPFTPPPPSANIGVIKTVNTDSSLADRDIVYTITVTNSGPDAAANADLNDPLPGSGPSRMTFVSLSPSSPPGWSCTTPSVGATGTVDCTNPSLAASGSQVFTLVGHIPPGTSAGTTYHNIATVTTTTSDPSPENNTYPADTAVFTCLTNPIVTTNANSGAGSLRQGILDACDGANIVFDMSQVVSPITLASELSITKSLTISGPGASQLTISGNTVTRVFNIGVPSPGAVTFSDLTIANGKVSGNGGGIFLGNTGTFNLNSSVLSGNVANFGGGIANASSGVLNVSDSTLNNNSAPGIGGGILNQNGAVNVTNSTFSFNSSGTGDGGGINNANNAPVTITNSTFSNNSANGGAGGGLVSTDGTVILTNSTFSNNSAGSGGGISNLGATPVQLRNSIFALNTTTGTGPDVKGVFTSNGHNLIGNNSAATITPAPGATGDLIGTNALPINPLLGSLQNNGGPTQTRALLAGSPALDAGDNCVFDNTCTPALAASITTDQRGTGFARKVDGPDAGTTDTVDIGAFEAQVSVEDITDKSTNEDTQLQFTFNVGGAASITSVTAVSGNPALVPNNVANIAVSGSGSTRTLTINALADKFGTSTITVTVNGNNSQSMTDTFVLTVNAVADTPSVTNATTNEDTQTTSGLVISVNPADGAEVTHFKITGITNGTLFKNNGTTQINNGDFITIAEGNAGLKSTPAANLFSPSTTFSFQVQGATSAGGSGLGSAATATITVNTVADTPSVTDATTTVNNQTTSGLVITRNPADGAEVTNFKITGITNGTLFKNNGTTQINNNDFITVAEGNAGLKFTPANNSNAAGSLQVQASLNNTNGGLGGSTATATITVNCGPTVVTSSNDSGAGSLRATINSACPGSTITFDMSQVTSPITLTSSELVLDKSLTIQGPGANQLTVSGNNSVRVFNITSTGVITFSGLTISNGKVPSGNSGGGILNNSTATVNITNSTVSNNSAGFGGGILNFSTGVINVSNSTLNNNTASPSGGAIFNNSTGTINVTNSTISGNIASGGGIFNVTTGPINIVNSTISGNSAPGGAGAGGGIHNNSASPVISLKNTIVALNTAGSGTGPDLVGPMTSQGNNLIGKNNGSTGFTNGSNGDIVGTIAAPINPLLGLLANNGGSTQTMALLPGSPAINAGTITGAPATDQRGISRVGAVDIGAFESRGFTIAATNGTPQSATITTTFGAPLEATVSNAFGEPVAGGVLTFTAPASGPSGTFTGNVTTANFTIGASGMASPTFTANTLAGSYTVTATANGITSAASFSLTNTKANTFTSVTSSSNPSDLGQSVTFTATVTSVATPAGTVQFKIDGVNAGGPVTLDANGVATFVTASLTVGNHSIVADYSGNANFNPSTNSLPGSQVVRPSPSLSINDVSTTEGDSGTKTLTFTVTLSAASNQTVTVDFATANGTALSPSDYQSASGTLTFTTGQTTKTIGVSIKGDVSFEPDENFTVNLTNPANAVISKNQGTGKILNDDVQGGLISFSPAAYSVSENANFVTLTVNRANDTSGAATVDYATDDTGAPAVCSNTSTVLASARCDFTTAMGTLRFAAGETQKTFTVLVNRDSYAESSEQFTVNLSNLTGGAAFATPSSAIVTITNSPEGPPANLIDDASFFVRQQYHDFLNREPDAAGLAFWTNQITSCGADAQCIDIRRVNVSAAFFLSIEFQETGGTAYLTNKTAFGSLPTYNRFERDSQGLGRDFVFGAPGSAAVLEANKVAYFNEYVVRPEFTSIYGSLLNGQYVDALIANTGVSFTQPERDALVNGLNGNTETRATVLRKITEKPSFRQAETNRMFVLMEYFGYLRRDPDAAGFNFWLDKLNQFNGNFVNADMVKAFITSGEYRGRFGP
jgi:CSLREA domain-containing protein